MIYLDNSATTRTLNVAADTAKRYMTEFFFNTGAAYSPAVAAEKDVNLARARLAAAMGAQPDEIIYTSGGTESNNMAINGVMAGLRERGKLVISTVEHPSVYEMAKNAQDFDVEYAHADPTGTLDLEYFKSVLTPETTLVSIMHVNNETGAINDLKAIQSLVKFMAPDALFHADGVQAFLKVPFDARHCDLYSISGHKFNAPKGIGALYVKKGIRFMGGQIGGGQEFNMRSGTLNAPGIMGMDAAVAFYIAERERLWQNMQRCKMRLYARLTAMPDVLINGPEPQKGAPHILNASFLGIKGEVMLHALAQKKIYVSTGSACAARKQGKNRILTEMGIVGDRQESAIRFSLCPFNTLDEMDAAANAIEELLPFLRRFTRR